MNLLSKRLILTLVAAMVAAGAAAWWVLQDNQGRLTAGSTPGVWTLDQAAAFDGYPVFYLGKEFEGLALMGVIREVVDDNPDSPVPTERDGFIFTYGDCTIRAGNDSCALPLSVKVSPRCYAPPELFPVPLRGPIRAGPGGSEVQLLGVGTHVRIGEVDVRIGGGGASHERAVEALRAINSAAVGSEAAKLSPPIKSVCAKIQGRDREKVLSLGGGAEVYQTPAPEAASSGPQLDLAVTDNGTSLTVKVNLSGTVTAPYAGAQITFHVPSALLQFGGGSAAGPLSGALCVGGVTPDAPVPGWAQVNFGCSLPGGKTVSGTGTLLNVTLNEIGNGCAGIVMHTVPRGTTTNAPGGGAQANTYGVTTAQVTTVGTGGVCSP